MVSDAETTTLEMHCENLMDCVVEARKHYGKRCAEYAHKTSVIENKILEMKVNTISNYHFKPKHQIPELNVEDMSQDIDDFSVAVMEKQRRVDDLLKRLKNTHEVVALMKRDELNKKARQSLSAETLLARVKGKH